jgi:glycine cleavage system aminomethyltransferase T
MIGFLSADSEIATARSPMERLAKEAGAGFERLDGWSVTRSFGDLPGELLRVSQTVGYADRSHLRKLELPGDGANVGTARLADDGAWWCPVTPARTLVLGGSDSAPREALDLTSAHAAMALIGPAGGELLARFCAIDVRPHMMPVGAFRPGSVARTPGYVLRTAPDALLLIVGWALGAYLWETVALAAAGLGGGPVGEAALSA